MKTVKKYWWVIVLLLAVAYIYKDKIFGSVNGLEGTATGGNTDGPNSNSSGDPLTETNTTTIQDGEGNLVDVDSNGVLIDITTPTPVRNNPRADTVRSNSQGSVEYKVKNHLR
jgi:hypothetical protein|tara:strand:+ start:5906 stop:6244 length:339 start_codon:yes stop_codon:yes gene_type:complete